MALNYGPPISTFQVSGIIDTSTQLITGILIVFFHVIYYLKSFLKSNQHIHTLQEYNYVIYEHPKFKVC
jgi:hypothetical protein